MRGGESQKFQLAGTSTTTTRETGVSRHQGGPIEEPPETPHTSQHYHIDGINYVKGNGNIVFPVPDYA